MSGAIAGVIAGTVWENTPGPIPAAIPLFVPGRRFADNTVLTVAPARVVLDAACPRPPARAYAAAYNASRFRYHGRGDYGRGFRDWCSEPTLRLNELYGIGSAMRVSPVPW